MQVNEPQSRGLAELIGYLPLIIFAVVLVYISMNAPNFLTFRNLELILMQSLPVVLVCAGLGAVVMAGGDDVVSGGIDLSIPATAVLSAGITAVLLTQGWPLLVCAVAALLACLLVGLINAVLVTRIGMTPLLTTLAMFVAVVGVNNVITSSRRINVDHPWIVALRAQDIVGVPLGIILVALIVGVIYFATHRTPWGLNLQAAGGEQRRGRNLWPAGQSAVWAELCPRRLHGVHLRFLHPRARVGKFARRSRQPDAGNGACYLSGGSLLDPSRGHHVGRRFGRSARRGHFDWVQINGRQRVLDGPYQRLLDRGCGCAVCFCAKGTLGMQTTKTQNMIWPILLRFGFLLVFAAFFVLFATWNPVFLQGGNLLNIVEGSAILMIIALGMTLIVATGGIDLSVGIALDFGAAFAVVAMKSYGMDWFGAACAGITGGCLVGIFNAILVVGLRISPFLATLSTFFIGSSVQRIFTNGGGPISHRRMPEEFRNLALGDVFGIPTEAVIATVLVVIYFLVLERSIWGPQDPRHGDAAVCFNCGGYSGEPHSDPVLYRRCCDMCGRRVDRSREHQDVHTAFGLFLPAGCDRCRLHRCSPAPTRQTECAGDGRRRLVPWYGGEWAESDGA